MTDIFVTKVKTATSYALMPAHQSDLEAIKKLPNGEPVRCKVTRVRNVGHHRKFFALLKHLFEIWEPDERNQVGEKNFDRFRDDLTILAGYYKQYVRIDGSTRTEAESISFASMSQDTFEGLFDKMIDVGLKYVATNYTGDELRAVVDGILEFDQ